MATDLTIGVPKTEPAVRSSSPKRNADGGDDGTPRPKSPRTDLYEGPPGGGGCEATDVESRGSLGPKSAACGLEGSPQERVAAGQGACGHLALQRYWFQQASR